MPWQSLFSKINTSKLRNVVKKEKNGDLNSTFKMNKLKTFN